MPEKTKENDTTQKKCEEPPEKFSTDAEKTHDYYDDDAHGYEIYIEEDEENEK